MSRRGLTMLETVTALSLAVGLALAVAPVVLQSMRAVAVARAELRAGEALQSVKDRIQAGALRLPADLAATHALPSDLPGITLHAEALETPPPAAELDLRAVRLVASWTTPDGATSRRALDLLVAGGRS